MPVPTSCIQFSSIFPKKAQIILCKTSLDGLVRVWPNTSGSEASRCARIIEPGSGGTQPTCYQFPTFRLGFILPQMAWIALRKTSPDLIGVWLTMSGFGSTDLVQKRDGVQGSAGQLLS